MRTFFRVFIFTISWISGLSAQSQDEKPAPKHRYSLYFHWGYNRAQYSKSDIHFKGGEDFDFTLKDVVSRDVPEKFSDSIYFSPTKLTIPQFNFRIGINLDDKWTLSFGWDHLKYYVFREQDLTIDGYINKSASDEFAGTYNDTTIRVPYRMLTMEHTDGLNYIHLNLDRIWNFYEKKWFKASLLGGVGTGPVCPWTDTRLFGTMYRNPTIHFAGWGLSVNATPRITLFNRFFVEGMFRVGHVRLWDTMIIRDKWTSQQNISYYERNITAGFNFPLNPDKKRKEKPVEIK